MTEPQVGYLCKAAASLSNAQNSRPLTLLKSHYLMKCKEITNGYGLPEKIFSPKARCSRCCTEWKRKTPTAVRSIKLSKRQRKRIRSLNTNENKKHYVKSRLELLHSKEMEQLCDFCKKTTVSIIPKPEKVPKDKNAILKEENIMLVKQRKDRPIVEETKASMYNKNQSKQKNTQKKINEINVYTSAKDVFSLNHKSNSLTSVKGAPKVIKNNKKKKDKFAGLCAKAVLASAKLKEEKEKPNKLSLFLKPSSDGK